MHIIAHGVGNIPTNFGVSMTFRSRLIGQHLSDASCDLATLTFDLGGHGACGSSASSYQMYGLICKLISLALWHIFTTKLVEICH